MNGEFDHGRFQGQVMEKLNAIHEDVKDQEKRIRILEKWRWVVLGMAAATGAGAGIAVPKIASAFF